MSRPAKFDQLKVAEISVNFLEASPSITAKAAFISTQTGQTHGWTTGRQWSPETLEKLAELRASMERDLAVTHFEDGAISTSTPVGSIRESFAGLGEHLGSAGDIPQG